MIQFKYKHRLTTLPAWSIVLSMSEAKVNGCQRRKAKTPTCVCAVSFYGIISWHGLRSGKQVHYLQYFVLKGHKSFICDATLQLKQTPSLIIIIC